uniref:Beta-tubulin n=1 Tax=Peronospora matthiolae TaxID=2874970 RepID=A0AAV1US02_9STRA
MRPRSAYRQIMYMSLGVLNDEYDGSNVVDDVNFVAHFSLVPS